MKENNKRKNYKEYIFYIVIAVLAVLIAMRASVLEMPYKASKADTKSGLQILKQMETIEVTVVEAKIQKLEEQERQAWAKRTPNEKFAHSLVMGDSITQGLYEFGVLDQAYVAADRGIRVSRVYGKQIDAYIARAIEMKPQILFLAYGMNDVEAVKGNADKFAEEYRKVLDELQTNLPDTKIYVNSVLPANKAATKKRKEFAKIPQFNEKLKALCIEENVTFIDNTSLVEEKFYAGDGIHMAPGYYKKWVNHMAEVAGL